MPLVVLSDIRLLQSWLGGIPPNMRDTLQCCHSNIQLACVRPKRTYGDIRVAGLDDKQ